MWFSTRKHKNRRLGRAYVLDVKLRSSKLRAARFRFAALGLSSFFALLFAAYMLWCAGEWTLRKFVYENEAFGIREVDLQTDGVMAVDQLRWWSGVKVGQNLFAVDLAQVQRRLELIPMVKSASIERVFPSTLVIRIVEREPLAQVYAPRPRVGGGLEIQTFHLDPEGYVMMPLEPRYRAVQVPPEFDHYPAITGVDVNDLQPGRRIQSSRVNSALQLLLAFDKSPMAGFADIQQIDISSREVLVVSTGQGSRITFAANDPDIQLRRWHAITDDGSKTGKALASLDLAIPNNIPATWLEPTAPKPAPPKAIKPLKRKHV